ncbi:MAG: PAS domain S-box protein [Pseudomonadota bacterium]
MALVTSSPDRATASAPAGAWDEGRVEALGPALVTAANAARIGLAVVLIELPEPRVVYMSDVGVEIIGHPKEAILNMPAITFLTPEEREVHKSGPELASEIPQNLKHFETTVLTGDRRRVPVEVSMAPLELEGQFIVVVFFRDISERHRWTEALRQSEERFRKLIELAPDAIWINDGRALLYVNHATVRMLGYQDAEEVLRLSPLDIVHPDEHPAMIERSRQMMASGQPIPSREYRIRRHDGTMGVTEVQSMPVDWEGKKAILGFARDVTARKEMESQLVRSDRLAALGTLLAGIAHEMNNPLAYVLLGIEQAFTRLDEIAAPASEVNRVREVLEDVRQGANRVAAVVGQLRATSRPEARERGVVDVGQALRAALRVAGNEIRHRARLATSLADIPVIDGSAQRLEQVFLNLLVNATQALPEGRSENEITVSLREREGGIQTVEIKDNGNGIPPEILPRIFDPFFTTKAVGVGMGLGLSICHGIITAHGGSIDVDSEVGRGTRFRVNLPIRRSVPGPEASAARAVPVSAPKGARRRRLLVVDDEPALGTMIQRMLSDDFDVDFVTDGRQGLDHLCSTGADYDTVLCDIMMPEMTGMELHAAVAERRPGLARRFVFMTGGAFTPRALEFLTNVSNPRLEKPFDVAALRAVIDVDGA